MSDLQKDINELSVGVDPDSSEPHAYELMHQSETARIFCCGDLGVKTLIDPSVDIEKRMALLRHEHNISSRLPSSYLQRKVLRVEVENGIPAMYFEWVDGVSAGEWLRPDDETQPLPEEFDCANFTLNEKLHVVLAIAKAVCGFHDAGLIHGQLSLDNIVLDFNGGISSCTSVLIDYSESSACSDGILDEQQQMTHLEAKKQKDLNDLGLVMYSILSNHISGSQINSHLEENDAEEQTSKRGKRQQVQETADLPLYIISRLSSLLTPTTTQGGTAQFLYKNSRDVLSDLLLAAKNSDVYLTKTNTWSDLVTQPLMLPKGTFYGRRSELTVVQHAFNSMMEGNGKPCALVVSGFAGAGKSSLLKQVNKPLSKANGHMIFCKFNQNERPDTVLAAGFDSFFEGVLQSDSEEVKSSIKARIEDSLGDRVTALEESMPNLRVLLRRQRSVNRGDDISQALTLRWKFLLSSLVSAISSETHPIALAFEDLQWADQNALDTIQLIIIDTNIRYCLYCVSYRDTQIEPRLTNMIDGLQNQGVALWNIKLGSIEKESIDSLVSQTLCMPPTTIKQLSSIVRNKTGGVILFVTNFLKSLHEERLIYFNLTTLRYEYNIDKIQSKEVSSDIICFLSERVKRLPRAIQAGLKVAACLGSAFDLSAFKKANKTSDDIIDNFISTAVESGLIHESSPNQYKWSHDQLQEAAYSLIPMNKRETTHLLIGARIYLNSTPEEAENLIHDIVRNMNIGVAHLDSQERKTELAQLNLVGGDQSKKMSAFYSAANYYMTGIDLLDKDWQFTSYDLAMRLFNSATEMLIVTGHITRFESTINQPLLHAKTFDDRLPAYHTSIRFLCISGRFEEAIDTCFSILREVGEDFTSDITPETAQEEILQTELTLDNFSKVDMKSLPRLSDPRRIWMMKIMSTALLILYSTRPHLAYSIGCRMTKRSIEYGWCSDSAFGLYAFGQGLISVTKKVDEGCLWVKVGLALLESFNDRARLPVLESLYHAFVSFWKEPIQITKESLIGTHKEALLEGQMEFSMSSALHSCRHSFMCGTSLAKLNNDCISVTNKMVDLKQMWSIMFHSSLHCLVLKLMGKADGNQAFDVFRESINNEEDLLSNGINSGKQTLVQYIYLFRLIHAFWLQNYDDAAQMAGLYGRCHMRFLDIYHVFYEGITALRLARMDHTDRQKWIDIGENAVATFGTWKDYNTWNFENKYLLLTAELHHTRGEDDAAEIKYKASIDSARNHRFVHEEGLAMESLGLFYKATKKEIHAREFLMSARICYENWGACAVVARLDLQSL